MKYHAFISYSRKDFDEVNAFIQKIKTEVPEFEYWFDLEGIESGDKFVRKMVSAIDNSERLLFMLSDNSINSEWAEQEVMYARNSDKRVIPILLKGAKLKGWFLFTFGNIDTIDTQDSRQVTKLISNLCRWCGSKKEKTDKASAKPESVTQPQATVPKKTNKKPAKSKAATVSPPKADVVPTTSKATTTQATSSKEYFEIPEAVKIKGKYGFRFKNGEIAIPCIYDYVGPFSEGRAKIKKNGKFGYIDLDGNIIIPCIYDYAYSFSKGRATIKKGGIYGYIDLNGKDVTLTTSKATTTQTAPSKEEVEILEAVKIKGKYGFRFKNGEIAIPCIYDYVGPFSEGRAKIKKNGKFGYIDLDGNIIIPCIYDYAYSFSKGRATIKKGGIYGYIDLNGNEIK